MNELMSIQEQVIAPSIQFNFDELKEKAKAIAETYSNLAITDSTYKSAKADAKALGGYIADIEKRRKDIKKQLEAPIKEFDAQCKEVEEIIGAAKKEIEAQTIAFDEKRRDEKRAKLTKYRDDLITKIGLNPEYAARLVLTDDMGALSNTLKEDKEKLDSAAASLKEKQDLVEAVNLELQTAIQMANDQIEQKLVEGDFSKELADATSENRATPYENGEITKLVMAKASRIREAEEAIRNQALAQAAQAAQEKAREEEQSIQQDEIPAEAAIPADNTYENATAGKEDIYELPQGAENNTSVHEAPVDIQESHVSGEVSPVNPFTGIAPATDEVPVWEAALILKGPSQSMAKVRSIIERACIENGCQFRVTGSRRVK